MTRVRFTRLTSRQGAVWGLGTLVVAVALLVYLVAQDPSLAVYALVLPVLLLVLVAVTVRHRQWLELDGAEPVLVQRRLITSERVGLHTAGEVSLHTNGAGTAMLWAHGKDRSRAFAPVLALTPYVQRSQPAEVLDAAAAALEGSRAKGAAVVREQLLAQAAHVRSGGAVEASPLAGLAGDLTGPARGTGAAGSAGSLADGA